MNQWNIPFPMPLSQGPLVVEQPIEPYGDLPPENQESRDQPTRGLSDLELDLQHQQESIRLQKPIQSSIAIDTEA
jgi:hypothetical protein